MPALRLPGKGEGNRALSTETPAILDRLAAAAGQELDRLEKVANRPRHFIFGAVEESIQDDEAGYAVVFRHCPDQVARSAQFEDEGSLFKVGEQYIRGSAEKTGYGLEIFFPAEEMELAGVDPARFREAVAGGVEYVMDTRGLARSLQEFLIRHQDAPNKMVADIAEPTEVREWDSGVVLADTGGLNLSQTEAVKKGLAQRALFVWGPPGTGKTRTLAALTANLLKGGKRVLLTAMSNAALDNLLDAVTVRLGDRVRDIGIARLGKHMDDRVKRFGRDKYNYDEFGAKNMGFDWPIHVRKAQLVASTFAKLAMRGPDNPRMFDSVIADEVSMANVPNLAVAACHAECSLVLGGDPSQLPPVYSEDVEPNEWFRDSVFERAGIGDIDDPRVAFLDTQYRMQEEIGDLVSAVFYKGKLKSDAEPTAPLDGFPARVLFIDCAGSVEEAKNRTMSRNQRRYNATHADAAARAVLRGIEAGVRGADIGVIVPYNAQVVCVRSRIDVVCKDFPREATRVRVSTIHSFQGQERRVVVADFTDNEVEPGNLTADKKLINVALSRAREALVMVGNAEYLTNKKWFPDDAVEMFGRIISCATGWRP